MRINPIIFTSAAAIAITCAVSAAAYYYKSRNKEINEVMVFCKLQFNAHNCFDKLISYIEAAKHNIDVCMPSIQIPSIQGRLIKLINQKNIIVRVIIDRNGYNDSTDFFLKELMEAGVHIKCRMEEYDMQHKFCLIDDKTLMTGTLNWGDDLSSDNWNYVYITSKPQLVDPIKREFAQMWSTDMDLEDAMDLPELCSDEDTSQDTSKENITLNEPTDQPTSRELQVTPELCIA